MTRAFPDYLGNTMHWFSEMYLPAAGNHKRASNQGSRDKGILQQDIKKLSTEREGMSAHMEGMCERIGELFGGDLLLMKTLGDMLNTSVDGDDWSTDLVDFDKLHVSTVHIENGNFSAMTKKHEANVDGRAPLREVNNLHM